MEPDVRKPPNRHPAAETDYDEAPAKPGSAADREGVKDTRVTRYQRQTSEAAVNRSRCQLDRIDKEILRQLEGDCRLTEAEIATRVGADVVECTTRIRALEGAGHIGGYTIVRNYPDPEHRPVSAVVMVIQDPLRTGADLLRSFDFIPEILTAEVLGDDSSLLLRLQTSDPGRVEEITEALRIQSGVVAVHATTTMPVFSRQHISNW